MPFTFSHPAAVLPLTFLPKRWFSLTGLVIGSLTPDFEYFIRMKVYSAFSHSWTGLFWFCLPLAMILASVFHLTVRDRLIDSLPHFLQKRFIGYKGFIWTDYFKKNLLVIIISCIIGATTHILWDGFTHEHGYFVQEIGSFRQGLFISGHNIPIYKVLQHLSTLVGGLILIYVIGTLLIRSSGSKGINWRYWAMVAFIALVVLTLRAIIGDNMGLGDLIVSAISGGLVGLTLTPTILSPK